MPGACLWRIVLEKTLKAFYVKDNRAFPPKTHKLDLIAEKTKLSLSAQDLDFLKEVNEFNLEARYPDYKFKFHKLCTADFSRDYFNRIKTFYKWLLKEIK